MVWRIHVSSNSSLGSDFELFVQDEKFVVKGASRQTGTGKDFEVDAVSAEPLGANRKPDVLHRYGV